MSETDRGGMQCDSLVRALDSDPTYVAYVAASNALARVSADEAGLAPLKVAVLRNFTIDPLLPVLGGEIARSGFMPSLHVGAFDAVASEVLDPRSALYAFAPDLVIVAQWLEALSPALATRFITLLPAEVENEIERVVATIEEIANAFRRASAAPLLVNNFPLPIHTTLGILDAQSDQHHTHAILRLNHELLRRLRAVRDAYVVDYLSVFARVGGLSATDERYWQIGRAPLGRPVLIPLGREYGKFVRALRGRTRKCLVLDCDNTLWGGIVGEDGISGIQLGATAPGSSYVAFQREVLNLRERGVILAVCSKNDEADVREVFRSHSDMLLREEHVATWQVNWDDKATNIRRVARDLNIGLDSIVFVDDSPFECGLIRDQVPEVAVLSLDGDPASFRAKLAGAAHFDSLTLSAEDRERGRLYAGSSQRRQIEQQSGSLEEYLAKLQLVAEIARADDQTIPRVTQLTQKTNQFNLTTRRYSEGQIRALVDDPDTDVLCLTLSDRVAPLGLIGVAIVRYEAETAAIDTFLLSCRAIGRGAEEALLAAVLRLAQGRGCARAVGRYEATTKNGMVAEFFRKNGFSLVGQDARGSDWERSVSGARFVAPSWISVVSRLRDLAHAD
jgi:FkbH-like protein